MKWWKCTYLVYYLIPNFMKNYQFYSKVTLFGHLFPYIQPSPNHSFRIGFMSHCSITFIQKTFMILCPFFISTSLVIGKLKSRTIWTPLTLTKRTVASWMSESLASLVSLRPHGLNWKPTQAEARARQEWRSPSGSYQISRSPCLSMEAHILKKKMW